MAFHRHPEPSVTKQSCTGNACSENSDKGTLQPGGLSHRTCFNDILLDGIRRLRKKAAKLASHARDVFAVDLSLARVLIPHLVLSASVTAHSATRAVPPHLSSHASSLKTGVSRDGGSAGAGPSQCVGLAYGWGRGPARGME